MIARCLIRLTYLSPSKGNLIKITYQRSNRKKLLLIYYSLILPVFTLKLTLYPRGMQLQIDHYSIYCFDLEKSIWFYSKVMGFTSKPRPNFDFPGHWFDLGNTQELHLISGRGTLIDELPRSRNIHYAFKTNDIVVFKEHLDHLKIPMIGPKKRPDGIMQIFIQDPDGYWIEITE